jgi:hypothetical protein
MQRHESSDGHPSLARGIEGLGARLIRVETLQQGAEIAQKRMEDKLDVLLRLLYRLPSGGNAP